MRYLFSHQDFTLVGHYQSVLEAEGILTFVRNQNTNMVFSEIPAGIFFPTLCVVNNEDYEQAMTLLRPLLYDSLDLGPDWICSACSEPNPDSFEYCWNCKTETN
jgi:Putative prokaryotic signal transducing protein